MIRFIIRCLYLIDVSLDLFTIDQVLGNTILIDAHSCKDVEHARVNLSPTVGNNTDDHLLPATFAPNSTFGSGTEVGNISHDPVHSPSKENFIFIVHGNHNEQ